MLRGTFGFGGLSETLDAAAPDPDHHTRLSGVTESMSFDAGGAVGLDVMLHVRIAAILTREPHSHIDGVDYDQDRHSYASAFLLAPAATYYFMPANIYVTGAFGMTRIALRYQIPSASTARCSAASARA